MQAHLPAVGDVIADKYRLERLLGQGGMGAVFAATHLITGKRVALKCLLPKRVSTADDVERFLREARMAARVSHPNVVDVYDVGEERGTFFLVMQLLDGAPLSSYLGRRPLPLAPAVRTLLQAMRGVQAAHKRGVIHRDLKPDNIFLCEHDDGGPMEPKVLDFGIAKLCVDPDSLSPSLTQSGAVMGTPHYMSPEQARDSGDVDERTDVYAFGVMLYELLAGVRPFEAQSLTALLLLVARGETASLRSLRPEVPEALEAIIARAMAAEPHARFDSVASLSEALQPFAGAVGLSPGELGAPAKPVTLGSQTPLAVESAVVESARATAPRRPGRGVVVLLALSLVLVVSALWLRARRDEIVMTAPAAKVEARSAVAPSPAPLAPTPAPATEPAPEPAAAPTLVAPATARKRVPPAQSLPAADAPTPVATDAAKKRGGRLGVSMARDQF